MSCSRMAQQGHLEIWSVTAYPFLIEDNTIRPGFNNASAAVKPLRLHARSKKQEAIKLCMRTKIEFKLPRGMGYVIE